MLMKTKRPPANAAPAAPVVTPRYLAASDAAAYLGVGLTHFTNVMRPQLPWHNLSNPESDRQIIRWSVTDLDAFASARRVA